MSDADTKSLVSIGNGCQHAEPLVGTFGTKGNTKFPALYARCVPGLFVDETQPKWVDVLGSHPCSRTPYENVWLEV